jgi:ligand-binding sensor domain-containing protein
MKVKIKQIATATKNWQHTESSVYLFALDSEGNVWQMVDGDNWHRIKDLPGICDKCGKDSQ